MNSYMSARTARSPKGLNTQGTWHWCKRGQSGPLRSFNPQRIWLGVREDSQISPGDRAWCREGQSDLIRGLNPQEIQLGVGKESQIFSELESPGNMDSDFSGGRGKTRR
jgi:hypothetical protein